MSEIGYSITLPLRKDSPLLKYADNNYTLVIERPDGSREHYPHMKLKKINRETGEATFESLY